MKRLPILALAAMLALTGSALAENKVMVQPEDESGTVQAVQSKLAVLGYYKGDITARYGERTAGAIKAFETDFGLTADGILYEDEYTVLMNAAYRPIKYGSTGIDVERLQIRLADLGYYKGKISGNYLEATRAAVIAFQDKMGTVMSGEADLDTQELLYSKKARAAAATAIKGSTTPEPESTELLNVPDGSSDQTGITKVTPAPTVSYTKQLKKGSSGEAVKKVQERLTDLLYYTGPISGSYQDKTVSAVKRFQEQNGLKADGKVGQDTWNALFNSGEIVPPDATACPTAEPTPVPDPAFHITVDVTNQVVTVYGMDNNGEYTKVIRQMICSSGTRKNPSDVGDWTLSGRKATWCYFPAWGDYARYWTKINASIAFHSVIYAKVDTMSLSVKSYKKLGSRASHGCVRLLVSDAKWVYNYVDAGTVVTITQTLPSDPELRDSVKTAKLNTSNMLPYETPQPTQKPVYISGAVPPQPLTKLSKGDSSVAVYWLQCKLTELGYYTGTCTGTYLDGTQDAVRAYQKANGLKSSGTADVATLKTLYKNELALSELTVAPTQSPIAIATPAAP